MGCGRDGYRVGRQRPLGPHGSHKNTGKRPRKPKYAPVGANAMADAYKTAYLSLPQYAAWDTRKD